MKIKGFTIIITLLLITLYFTGCNTSKDNATTMDSSALPEPTVNIQATVEACISATNTVQAQMQEAAGGTLIATITAMPTKAPPPPDEISEEDLAQMIDEAVTDAMIFTRELKTATMDSTADSALTRDELDMLMSYYSLSQSEIEYALSLTEMYLEIYRDLGGGTVDLLYLIEEDLNNLSYMTDEAKVLIYIMENIINNGRTVTPDDVTILIEHSRQYNDLLTILGNRSGEWFTSLQEDMPIRAEKYLKIKSNEVAETRQAAFSMANDYVSSVQDALGDGFLSSSELNSIAQLGANVKASFRSLNLLNSSNITETIDGITSNLARGQLPTAAASIGQLEGLIR